MTSIEWTDETWNPVRGCSRVSPGCDNCYAMRQAHRFNTPSESSPYHGLTTIRRGKVDWSGRVRLVREALDQPVRWRKPRRIFVNSMSDLFHEALPDEAIDEVLAVMGACDDLDRGHTFQVLTKRGQRMRRYMTDPRARKAWNSCRMNRSAWPASNLWLGVSAEDQARADERVPHLLATPAVVRFVSAEPLLGPIDFDRIVWETCGDCDPCIAGVGRTQCGQRYPLRCLHGGEGGIDWVIVGGESGNGARPFDVQWARDVVRQCRKVGVACFVKQLGANVRDRNDAGFDGNDGDAWDIGERLFDAVEHDPDGIRNDYQGAPVRIRLLDRKGGTPLEWPNDLRVREFPEVSECR